MGHVLPTAANGTEILCVQALHRDVDVVIWVLRALWMTRQSHGRRGWGEGKAPMSLLRSSRRSSLRDPGKENWEAGGLSPRDSPHTGAAKAGGGAMILWYMSTVGTPSLKNRMKQHRRDYLPSMTRAMLAHNHMHGNSLFSECFCWISLSKTLYIGW